MIPILLFNELTQNGRIYPSNCLANKEAILKMGNDNTFLITRSNPNSAITALSDVIFIGKPFINEYGIFLTHLTFIESGANREFVSKVGKRVVSIRTKSTGNVDINSQGKEIVSECYIFGGAILLDGNDERYDFYLYDYVPRISFWMKFKQFIHNFNFFRKTFL